MIPQFRTRYNRLSRELNAKRTRQYYYMWGHLAVNPENPGHYDANIATWETVQHPGTALMEVERTYREFGMTPRIRLTEYSAPSTLAAFLRENGYVNTNADSSTAFIMQWTHSAVSKPFLPSGVTIREATIKDVEILAQIQYEPEILGEWAYRYLTYSIQDPRIAYYIAEVESVPAATLALGQTKTLALIEDVTTASDFRRHGLAGWLLEHALHHAKSDVMLEVIMENARRIYERRGFEVVGTILDSRWIPDGA